MRAISCVLMLSLAAACGGDDDGSVNPDGGHPDAGHLDASVSTDAGASADGGSNPSACSATIKLEDYRLNPATVTLGAGSLTLCAVNNGKTPHDFVVRDAAKKDLGRTPVLGPGESAQLKLTLTAGTYGTYCSVAGHEALGMVGTLTVN